MTTVLPYPRCQPEMIIVPHAAARILFDGGPAISTPECRQLKYCVMRLAVVGHKNRKAPLMRSGIVRLEGVRICLSLPRSDGLACRTGGDFMMPFGMMSASSMEMMPFCGRLLNPRIWSIFAL